MKDAIEILNEEILKCENYLKLKMNYAEKYKEHRRNTIYYFTEAIKLLESKLKEK